MVANELTGNMAFSRDRQKPFQTGKVNLLFHRKRDIREICSLSPVEEGRQQE